jgi:hypothetical protein
MTNILNIDFLKRGTPSGLLGLALEGDRLEGVVLKRHNGSLQVTQRFTATLTLDPLTDDVELAGREILNHLQAAGVRERRCVVALPLKWALAAHVTLPTLAEADVAGFLQIEAERGFPTDVTALQVATSRLVSASGEQHATLVGIPRSHVERLGQALRAARLKPLSFSLGITALQPPETGESNGVMALVIDDNQIGLQISCGGGVAALRALEGAVETESDQPVLHGDLIAREARITLGQLPAGLRDPVKRIRVFGSRAQAQHLADEIRARFEPGGLSVEAVPAYPPNEFGRTIPPETPVSAAFSLAARYLAGHGPLFEFLPPKVSAWQQMTSKYASGKLRTAAIAAAAMLVVFGGAFAFQQWQLTRLRSQWAGMSAKVKELGDVQDQIQKYRPWFDKSFRYLGILKALTTAFPENGSVTAKTLEIRELPEARDVSVVSCSGNAASYSALQRTVHQLGAIQGVTELNVPTRGKTPIQFTFDFHLNGGGMNEN